MRLDVRARAAARRRHRTHRRSVHARDSAVPAPPQSCPVFLTTMVVVGGAYTAAFWNSTGSIGFAAAGGQDGDRARTAEPGGSELRPVPADRGVRRLVHIRAAAVRPRLRPAVPAAITLPDISFFVFADYMPHNSILWIWIKMGVGGFMTMLYLFARTIHRGVRLAMRLDSPNLTSVAIGSLVYVVMYIVYCYVDIGWDIRSTVFLAMAIAICADLVQRPRTARRRPKTVESPYDRGLGTRVVKSRRPARPAPLSRARRRRACRRADRRSRSRIPRRPRRPRSRRSRRSLHPNGSFRRSSSMSPRPAT